MEKQDFTIAAQVFDQGRRVKVRYLMQVSGRPPTFALFVNRPKGLQESYRR
jgi:GTP-binding protein